MMDPSMKDHKQRLREIDQRWVTIEPTNAFYSAIMLCIGLVIPIYLHSEGMKRFDVTNVDTGCGEAESKNITENEIRFKESIAFINYMKYVTESLPMLLYGTFLGAFGDKAGRKTIIIPALITALIGCICYTLLIFFKLDYQFFPLISFIAFCGGGPIAVHSGSAAYIGDISSGKRRMNRMIIMEVFGLLIVTLSKIGIGYILEKSITTPLYIVDGVGALLIVYTLFLVPESVQKDPKRKFFDKAVLLECLMKAPRLAIGGSGQKNTNLIRLLFLSKFFFAFIVMASHTIIVFYLKDAPFCWGSKDIGWYEAVKGISSAVSLSIMGKIVSKFNIKETSAIVFCFYLILIHFILNGVADSTTLIYVAMVPSILGNYLPPAMMNFGSKIVDPKDMGAMMAGMYWCTSLGMATGPIMWNKIYAKFSLHESSRAYVFYVGAAINVLNVIITSIIYFKSKHIYVKEGRSISVISVDQKDAELVVKC